MASVPSATSSIIPPKLSETLPNRKTPWLISESTFKKLEPVGKSYKRCEITSNDPEWAFVHRYFDAQRPTNRSIARVYCVHNSLITRQFETQIENSEAEVRNPVHAPQWKEKELSPLRGKVIERWRTITNPFSPFDVSPRQTDYKHTKILPLWHGSKADICHSICKTGFTFFGKQDLIHGGGAGKNTDIGFFGSGIYFTDSARYAAEIYSDGNLLLAWVSMREPYPVVADKVCLPPEKPKDMKKLEGSGAYQNYNAHFIPVISVDPKNKKCAIYYPCAKDQDPTCDEIVVFNKFQTLPRFWVQLQIDLAKSPSQPVATVNELLQKVLDLLDSDQVKQDKEIASILEKKSEQLFVLDPSGLLSAEDQDFYRWSLQLLNETGKVRNFVSKKLSQLHLGGSSSPSINKLESKEEKEHAKFSSSKASLPQDELEDYPAYVEKLEIKKASSPAVPAMAFGKAKWEKYFGDIGEEPPLPADIDKILQSSCPFWPDKKVEETHLLVLVPQTVDGKPLTLKTLGDLVQKPRQGNETQYRDFYESVLQEHGNTPADKSHWILMTRDVLPGSRNKSYAELQRLVSDYAQKSKIDYQIPNILDAVTAIFMEYSVSGTFLYHSLTYGYCQEKTSGYHLLVGDFSLHGLSVIFSSFIGGDDNIGVAASRKL